MVNKIKSENTETKEVVRGESSDSIKVTEMGATNARVKDINWDASQLTTERQTIDDPGEGKPIILRKLQYIYPPHQKGKPTKAQLITPEFKKYLDTNLWIDDLEMIQEPRVVYKKKGFFIFLTCQARKGRTIPYDALETMKPLQQKIQDEQRV